MTDDGLLQIINSDRAREIFTELYGESDASGRRCAKLITEMLDDGFQKSASNAAAGKLRIFTSPGRTELAGNHTDHNRGKVLAASIQLDCAAVVQARSDNIVFFRSNGFPDVKVSLTDSNGNPDLQPKPEEEGKTEALVRGIAAEFYKRGRPVGGFSANATSNVLPGSGLSSSAALEVLFARIFDSLYCSGDLSPLEIAQIGQIAENVYFNKPCGLMDQTACAAGGAVAIDFADAACPLVKQIKFDPGAAGFTLCVVNTGGSHADLTPDYASIPAEMKAAAAFFGKSFLRELEKDAVLEKAGEVRRALGDRVLLRAIHFFDENERVDALAASLEKIEAARPGTEKQNALYHYFDLINESGDSSWELLQNIYSIKNHKEQGVGAALALTKEFFRRQKIHGACRVHGGGFAGAVQVYIPADAMKNYRARMEDIFGADSVTPLRIRPKGAVELVF